MDTAQRLAQHFEGPPAFIPEIPRSIEETGLSVDYLAELLLKNLHVRGSLATFELSQATGLPEQGILAPLLARLEKEHLLQRVELKGASGAGYALTEAGRAQARGAMERNSYVGIAPVPLAAYRRAVGSQAVEPGSISYGILRQALAHLVLPEQILRQLGPAVNSGKALLLWGAPGNGKTATAEAIGKMLPGNIFVPHAIEIGGVTVPFFDHLCHQPVRDVTTRLLKRFDQRWIRTRRPVVAAGNELLLEDLDLSYDGSNKNYRAPLQMKANNGVLLIDDFGRQKLSPQALINRWMLPLEKRVDYLTLPTGYQSEVPFDTMVLFSTNLEPDELVDEAFLRRIRYKIHFPDPTPAEFREIFMQACRVRGIPYHDEALRYLVQRYYLPGKRPFRACHPRDLIEQLVDVARFNRTRPLLSKELLDDAANSYFIQSQR